MMKRLRLGIILIILSWLPFAQVLIWIAHNNNNLSSETATQAFRAAVWGIQIVVGLVGLWLVGKMAVQAAKAEGWRRTPVKMWQLFRDGGKADESLD